MAASSLSSWSLDYAALASPTRSRNVALVEPVGYIAPAAQGSVSTKRSAKTEKLIAQRAVTDPSALKMAKAWEAAIAPAKSLPMNAIMLYMSGSGVQIFSMMVVGMLITGPLKGIAGMDAVFSRYTSPSHSLLLPKLTFIAVQLAAVALGMYKCWSMGLLPTESSDWLAWRSLRTPLEVTPLRA